MRQIIATLGSLAVGFLMAAAGLYYDVQTLAVAGIVLFGLAAVLWLYEWGRQPRSSPSSTSSPLARPPVALPGHPGTSEVDKEGRILVGENVTPEFLTGLYNGVTKAQGDRLAAPYIGKWMRLSGPVGDAHTSSVTVKPSEGKSWPLTALYFDKELERLELLNIGDTIKILGRIKQINRFDMTLEECELVDG